MALAYCFDLLSTLSSFLTKSWIGTFTRDHTSEHEPHRPVERNPLQTSKFISHTAEDISS